MPLNLDKIAFYSGLPAFKNDDSGSFIVSIGGNLAASATQSWTGSVTFAHNNRLVRYSMQQNIVPSGAGYTINDRLPVALMVGGSNLSAYIGCTVSGSSTSVAPNIYITSSQTGATVTVTINNPNASTMVLTATTLTIYYTAFATFGEV